MLKHKLVYILLMTVISSCTSHKNVPQKLRAQDVEGIELCYEKETGEILVFRKFDLDASNEIIENINILDNQNEPVIITALGGYFVKIIYSNEKVMKVYIYEKWCRIQKDEIVKDSPLSEESSKYLQRLFLDSIPHYLENYSPPNGDQRLPRCNSHYPKVKIELQGAD